MSDRTLSKKTPLTSLEHYYKEKKNSSMNVLNTVSQDNKEDSMPKSALSIIENSL